MKPPVDRDTPTDTGLGELTEDTDTEPHSRERLTTLEFQRLPQEEQLIKVWEALGGIASRVVYVEKEKADDKLEIKEWMREIQDHLGYLSLCQATIMRKLRITPPPGMPRRK